MNTVGTVVVAVVASGLWQLVMCGDYGTETELCPGWGEDDFAPELVTIKIGTAEYQGGPTGSMFDTAYNGINVPGVVRSWTANGDTYLYAQGQDIGALLETPTLALEKGQDGSFDECGRWLNSVYYNGSAMVGWYHAEHDCNYPETHKSVGFCYSDDLGVTFKVPSPPQQVISPPPSQEALSGGHGDHGVALSPSSTYFYLWFLDSINWSYGLARATVSSMGIPGSWYKLFSGSFSSPGVGGDHDPLTGAIGTATYRLFSGQSSINQCSGYLSIGAGAGLFAALSPDGVDFTGLSSPLLFSDSGSWDRYSGCPELLAYPSILRDDGVQDLNTSSTTQHWLYYMYLQPGEDFSQRYLVRRPLEILLNSVSGSPASFVALTRYFSSSKNDHWVTTSLPLPNGLYGIELILGYLLTSGGSGRTKITDCYITSWDDHMVGIGDTDDACGAGGVALRTLGWVYTEDSDDRLPLYRCFITACNDHFVSTDPLCEGTQTEFLIGYTKEF
ncbi:hypothetical protein Pelo_3034 [Pelomyxa schiedti]|nr:hypothetical protein Pelo_3034 [Pelomyxa schiedti]